VSVSVAEEYETLPPIVAPMLPLRSPVMSGLEWPGLDGSGLRFNGFEGLSLEATDSLGVCLPLDRVQIPFPALQSSGFSKSFCPLPSLFS
jgi:hypothetical protein